MATRGWSESNSHSWISLQDSRQVSANGRCISRQHPCQEPIGESKWPPEPTGHDESDVRRSTQGAASGDPVIVAPMVSIASERSYPPAQSFSWQPVYR